MEEKKEITVFNNDDLNGKNSNNGSNYDNDMNASNGAFSRQECEELTRMYGPDAFYSETGCLKKLNEKFFTELCKRHADILFVTAENAFYCYNTLTGLWETVTKEQLGDCVCNFLFSYVHATNNQEYISLIEYSFGSKIVRSMRGNLTKNSFPVADPDKYKIHCNNCMLVFNPQTESWESEPFSPAFYSRNRTNIAYDPKAKAPRFMSELLQPAMEEEDIEILQRYVGQCLLGKNLSQTFLMLTGTAGGGKSTLVNIVEALISKQNCHELRLRHVETSRFETQRYIGKTLLTGKDVNSDFLCSASVGKIKALTGGDTLSCENKHSCYTASVEGLFNVLITSNSNLKIKMDGDADAWRRRMLWIEFTRPAVKFEKKIDNFAELLIAEEGSGILNWALEGAVKLLKENGKIRAMEKQNERINMLLDESDPVRIFVNACISPSDDTDVSCEELWAYFNKFCTKTQNEKVVRKDFLQRVPQYMWQLHSVRRHNNIIRNGHAVRGYAHISVNV